MCAFTYVAFARSFQAVAIHHCKAGCLSAAGHSTYNMAKSFQSCSKIKQLMYSASVLHTQPSLMQACASLVHANWLFNMSVCLANIACINVLRNMTPETSARASRPLTQMCEVRSVLPLESLRAYRPGHGIASLFLFCLRWLL